VTVDELVVDEDPARRVADLLLEATGNVALAGGSTPKRAYELARERRDWSGVTFWFSDERCVPQDDERSNYGMARAALLGEIEGAAVRRIRGELGGAKASRLYDEELRGVTIDLCLLGIGPDGHTASLFPGSPALEERERLAVAAEPGLEPRVERVTFTLPAIASAELVVFLVAGADKAEAAERAFSLPPSSDTPASLARGRRTSAYLDPEAASRVRAAS
jgi:6-phosphogluconolactonase